MRLIPGKTKVEIELFKGVNLSDILVGGVAVVMVILVLLSSLPGRLIIVLVIGILAIGLLARMDTVPNYIYLLHILRHLGYTRRFARMCDDQLLLARKDGTADEMSFERLFAERRGLKLSAREQRRQEKERRRFRKQEDKLLKSRKVSPEEKQAILDRRAAEEEDASQYGQTDDDSENRDEEAQETKQERKARLRAEKAKRKEEDRLLKSKTASAEEKESIRARREAAANEAAHRMAEAKDEETERVPVEQIMAFTGIENGFIEYGGKYFGAVLEIPAVEFRFFSSYRRNNAIEGGLGRVLRTINSEYSANIVKIERPIIYDRYLQLEYGRLNDLKASFESGMLSEAEYKARIEILYDRINDVQALCTDDKVIEPFYYLVLFESDKRQLNNQAEAAMNTLRSAEMSPRRLNDKELAVFLRYTNQLDFDEHDIERIEPKDYPQWAMPQTVDIKARTVEINHIITHNMRMVAYPTAVGDAWLASVMSIPGTKVVIKCRPMERSKAIRGIDRSLQELRAQYMATGVDSRRIELQGHIETLGNLLATLQQDNELLLEVNVYVTAYDIAATRANHAIVQPPKSDRTVVANMKKTVRRYYQENGFRLNNMEFDQMQAFIGSQVSGYDPMLRQSRGIPSNSLAACFPWIFAHVSDVGGIKLGRSQGVPVFIDFFRRDSERVNSNMVIVGKSGSGKSYATKSLLANLAAEDCKIFILDPENEYTELAENLHGKFINVGNAQYGRLNPFQIITALDDDETDSGTVSGSYATHLQFLEEFFRQILPDCDKDAMEYLNSLIDRMYTNHGITGETDLSRLRPEDYPVFDDLYDAVLAEFQQTDNEYIRTILRTLMNYVAKFSTGGRNANIWNGPSTVTTDENFTVFNFQSLISNRNSTIANAQMLLVLKYIDNEIIKNRDYNTKYGLHRKIVVVIDEAHVFIDTKFPVALDFMFQLAKRIRKYNGMQIVITQNIKDFVGSEEIARKSTAIINACQYSFIFSLAPNDIQDLCKLYEKAGGINEVEQEQITTAPRGQAFTVMSPTSRSTFRVEVPKSVVAMFHERNYQSRYFSSENGDQVWEGVVGESREKHLESRLKRWGETEEEAAQPTQTRRSVTFVETDEESEAASRKPEAAADAGVHTDVPAAEPVQKAQGPAAAQPAPAGTDAALTELLSRFSYDALLREIQRSVESAVDARIKMAQPVSAAEQEAKAADTEEAALERMPVAESMPQAKEVPYIPANEPMGEAGQPERAVLPEVPAPEPEDRRSSAAPGEGSAEKAADTTASTLQPAAESTQEDTQITESRTDAEETAEPESLQSEGAPPTETDDGMDIVAFLQANIGEIELPTPIETMEMFDEKVVDVSLEELIQYNNKQRGKRR